MIEWIQNNETVLWWLAASTLIASIATLIAMPILVVRLPADYFTRRKNHPRLWTNYHPAVRAMLLIGKNAIGLVFIAAGILMLVLPGQGVFTILIGIILLNFPGKYRLVCWVVRRGPVLRSMNWLRRRAGRDLLVTDG